MLALMQGMIMTYISGSIKRQLSHIQVHNPEWMEERLPEQYATLTPQLEHVLDVLPAGTHYSKRLMVEGMIQTARSTRGIRITGIETGAETAVTGLFDWNMEGDSTQFTSKNALFVGKALAKRMNLTSKTKVVLTFPDVNGELIAGSFKVRGMYSSGNSRMEEMQVYVRAEDVQALMGIPSGAFHELAILLPDIAMADSSAALLRHAAPGLDVQTYKQLSPDLEMYRTQVKISSLVMTSLVMLALIFGILNTMLMAVLERTREIGMLMAVGMKRLWIYLLIIFETLFLAISGLPAGLAVAYLTIHYFEKHGLDLTNFSDGLANFGMSAMVYPEVGTGTYIMVSGAVALTAVLASVYPALRAARLNPVQTLHQFG
jgi:ABC-type lipoprotein release transport system permease subunit